MNINKYLIVINLLYLFLDILVCNYNNNTIIQYYHNDNIYQAIDLSWLQYTLEVYYGYSIDVNYLLIKNLSTINMDDKRISITNLLAIEKHNIQVFYKNSQVRVTTINWGGSIFNDSNGLDIICFHQYLLYLII